MTNEIPDRKITEKNSYESDIADFEKRDAMLQSINKKVTSNKTKHVEDEKKLNELSEKI